MVIYEYAFGFRWSFSALNIGLVCFLICSILVGLIGNISIIGAICTYKVLWRPLNLFIINLSCADLVLVGVISCTSITGLTKGYVIFLENHKICNIVANICVTVCVVSLLTHMVIAITRYCSMRYGMIYEKMFTTRLTIFSCLVIWVVAFFLQFPPNVGWGRNVYDRKAMICIWDRTYSLAYTLYFAIVYVFTPISTIFYCYIRLFFYISKVRNAAKRSPPKAVDKCKDRCFKTVAGSIDNGVGNNKPWPGIHKVGAIKYLTSSLRVEPEATTVVLVSTEGRKWQREVRLARTLFSHFALVFVLWGQYAFLVIGDHSDGLPVVVHAISIQMAHSIAVFNVFIYLANKNFRDGMIQFLIRKPLRFMFPKMSLFMTSPYTTETTFVRSNKSAEG